jgi:peptidoglycan/LPS O-acetylase OafA/YrhL
MSPPRERLHFLDGLRGLACLYVLLFHASTPHIPYDGEFSPFMKFLALCLSRGRFSVVFFIVLSGFSIMLPIARGTGGHLRGGLADYARRRARRILPPYYVALIGSAGLILAYNALSARLGPGEPVVDSALGPGSLISHVFLVHNLRFDWAYRINGPMWSVATEWQIYFLFALCLLPLWRRAGDVTTLLVAWLVGSLPFFLLPPAANFFWACPWFLGSFAFGMWGAVIGFSSSSSWSSLRLRTPWGVLALACFAFIVALVASGLADAWSFPVVDFFVSLFAFFLLNACSQRCVDWSSEKRQQSLLLRVLGSRGLVYLGGFSYSLYLIQHPVLRLAEKVVAKVTTTWDANIQLHLLVAVPFAIAVAWLFSELFERPYTSGGWLLPALRRRLVRSSSESV